MANIIAIVFPLILLAIFETIAITLWINKRQYFLPVQFHIYRSILITCDVLIYKAIPLRPQDCTASGWNLYDGILRPDLR